jgi:hypothetical protein
VLLRFHHIHVNDHAPGHLLAYYGKLFDKKTTKPTTLGGLQGIEADGVFLLISPVPSEPPESGGAGWHFGWGTVALDEAYDRHRMQEIDLKLPMASYAKDLHVHIESEDPVRAAEWYRDRFSARIATDAHNAEIVPRNAYFRRPVAIVQLDGVTFAIYKSPQPLESSRGRRIDHLAFKADLREVRAAGFTVLEESGRLGPFETMTIEGPDRLVIELVGAPSLNRSSSGAAADTLDHGVPCASTLTTRMPLPRKTSALRIRRD